MASSTAFERVLRALSTRDWSSESARQERVAPLLHRALGGARFRRDHGACAARNLELLDALDAIASALLAGGVRPVLLKGADLATRLYPATSLRPMSDLDLWVAPEEAEATASALEALGLVPFCPEMTSGLNRRIRHARLYVRPGAVLAVDVHWSLVGHASDRRAPSLEWFRGRVVERGTTPLPVLDDTAGLLYLAAHAKLQHWDERAPLLWMVDFFLASHRDVEWEPLFAAAERFRWSAALAAMAREAEERLEIALPDTLRSFAFAQPLAPAAAPPDRRGGPERAVKELFDLDWRGRVALVRSYLFPSRDYLRFKYRPRASWTWPLLYPARWAGLFASAASLAAKRWRAVRS